MERVVRADPEYAQYLVDKWFWRSWGLFSILTGFSMDYLTPLERRTASFKSFMEEWIVDQFASSLEDYGLEKPWYWDAFIRSLDYYHHMAYASAYTYRATVWFDMVLPGPDERAWLASQYPKSWPELEPVWERVTDGWRAADPGVDFAVHGTAIVGFCSLCNIVLCGGTPAENSATTLEHDGQPYIFCSKPCRWIFERDPQRYAAHKDLVKRVLAGVAPANLMALLTRYCGLGFDDWGKDVHGGVYPWLARNRPVSGGGA
jgi:toluene monooxygenase system protein A